MRKSPNKRVIDLINYLKKKDIKYAQIDKTFSEDVGFYIVIPVFKIKQNEVSKNG